MVEYPSDAPSDFHDNLKMLHRSVLTGGEMLYIKRFKPFWESLMNCLPTNKFVGYQYLAPTALNTFLVKMQYRRQYIYVLVYTFDPLQGRYFVIYFPPIGFTYGYWCWTHSGFNTIDDWWWMIDNGWLIMGDWKWMMVE